jgi:tellurium resistance protein TerD
LLLPCRFLYLKLYVTLHINVPEIVQKLRIYFVNNNHHNKHTTMINLEKKKTFNLTKQAPGLNQVKIGLSWDPTGDGRSPDADASVFMLNESGKIPGERYFVFFNNLVSEDGAVVHSGDNRTGAGDGDDEEVNINLASVSLSVVQIMLVITIHNKSEGFHFGNVLNSSVRVYNKTSGDILCQYRLSESYDGCDSLIIGRFYRNGAEWEFEAMGQAFEGGLEATVELYS